MKGYFLFGAYIVMMIVATLGASDGKATSSRYAIASWYGPGLYGNPMACGGKLQPGTRGVASPSLPCGMKIKLCFNGKCVSTKVVDRGPFVPGRDFDLTAATANDVNLKGVQMISWWIQ